MNKKSGLVLRIILGGYLVFLGVSLLMQMIQQQPSDMVLKSGIAVVFIAVGGFYAVHNIKAFYKMIKAENEEIPEVSEKQEKSEVRFEKAQHDASLYRTAPMPRQDDVTLKQQKEEKNAVESTESVQTERMAVEETQKVQEKEEPADPVNLAIEIMQAEEQDVTESAEELENDYEER